MSPSPNRTAVAVVATVLLAGCAGRDAPGVGIQRLAADIVFGVRPPVDAPPPNLRPGRAGTGDATTYVPAVGVGGSDPFLEGIGLESGGGFRRRPRVTPLAPPATSCPPAALTAFPAREAGVVVEGLPVEGQYRWKRQGTQTVANLPGLALPVGGFEQRLVRNVVEISDTEYTFETVQPELGGDVTTISTFKVKTGAVSQAITPPVQPPGPTAPTPPVPPPSAVPGPPELPEVSVPGSVSVGDPERGISLVKLQRVDAAGNSSELTFSPAVLYLPLRIVAGEEFSSAGIDPRTGAVLQHRAKVLKRERVDACGEVVDGWLVESTQTFSGAGAPAASRTYRYTIAPQFGGIMIAERIQTASPQGTTDVTLSLAQRSPAPLPAEQGAPK